MKLKISNRYIKTGLMCFVVGVLLIVFFFVIHHTGSVGKGIAKINDILNPFYIGIILAYLLCPIYNWVVRTVYHNLGEKLPAKVRIYRLARVMGTVIALGVLFFIIAAFIMMVIPNLIESIVGIVGQLPETVKVANQWFRENIQENPQLADLLQNNLQSLTDKLMAWFQEKVLPLGEELMATISEGVISTIGMMMDMFIALVICVYILNSKEKFQAQAEKFILAVMKPEHAQEVFELGRVCNKTFGGFINGKIIDSIIIGILCFIVMQILGLPIAMLISVIVGLTNVIPFFGPFIGAIPSLILLLIIDPLASLKFLILILILQQVDGNIIGPKILGDSTGLASFWVMFAIIVGGGLFGFVGMILGVPTFAIIYYYVSRFINRRLTGKGYATETAAYEELQKFGINKEDIFGKARCTKKGEAEILCGEHEDEGPTDHH